MSKVTGLTKKLFLMLIVVFFTVGCPNKPEDKKQEPVAPKVTATVPKNTADVPRENSIHLRGFYTLEPSPIPEKLIRPYRQNKDGSIKEDDSSPRVDAHYVSSNENLISLFAPHLMKQRGNQKGRVFMGIGSDQNFFFADWSRPEVAVWLDFDQVVIDIHKLHKAFFSPQILLKNF